MKNKRTGAPSSNKTINILSLLLFMITIANTGCRPAIKPEPPEKIITPIHPWSLHDYAGFLKQNMRYRDMIYSTEYVVCDFEVDTDYGSTRIQNLIDPEAVSPIADNLGLNDMDYYDKILSIYDHVLYEYNFQADPDHWQTVEETIKAKKGDCKDLSLLLISLLLSAGIDAHAAISNWHMWINVFHDNEWQVLEVDKDAERKKIYQIPGFYENPLFKVFVDRTEKRKRF